MTEGDDFTLSISTLVIEAGTSRRCVFVSILSSAEVEMEEEIQLGFDPSAEESIGDPNITTIVIASDGSKPLKLTDNNNLFTHSLSFVIQKQIPHKYELLALSNTCIYWYAIFNCMHVYCALHDIKAAILATICK